MEEQAAKPASDAKRVFGTTAIIVAIVGVLGAGAWFLLNWDYVEFRIYCSEYRSGNEWYSKDRAAGSLQLITWNNYFKNNHKGMAESKIIQLLGPPRVEKDKSDDGYVDIREWLERLGVKPNGSERVLVYNEYGPPDHFIGDETENIFLLIRDGKMIAFDGLFP